MGATIQKHFWRLYARDFLFSLRLCENEGVCIRWHNCSLSSLRGEETVIALTRPASPSKALASWNRRLKYLLAICGIVLVTVFVTNIVRPSCTDLPTVRSTAVLVSLRPHNAPAGAPCSLCISQYMSQCIVDERPPPLRVDADVTNSRERGGGGRPPSPGAHRLPSHSPAALSLAPRVLHLNPHLRTQCSRKNSEAESSTAPE